MDIDLKAFYEKLRRIEALHAGATTPGERDAAAHAIERMRERLKAVEAEDPAIEYRFTLGDSWSRKLFLAIARRYGLKPYRLRGQRYTTVMVRVPRAFVDRTLWPEFTELSTALREALDHATDEVVAKVFNQTVSEAEVRDEPARLGPATSDAAGE